MAKQKQNGTVLGVLWDGVKIFCVHFRKYFLYMLFPVLGQFVGLFWVFGTSYLFSKNLDYLAREIPALDNFMTIMICLMLITLPGLILWMKAFWDYLVSYGALNSMTDGYLNTGRVYDFRAHNSVVSKKVFSYIALWLLFSVFTLVSLIPLFWIIGFIFFIYFILIFQVFTFENGLSPVGYFRRSLQLVKGRFARTFLLMILLVVFTYYLLTSGLSVIFDALNLTAKLAKVFESWAYSLPVEHFERFGITPIVIGKEVVNQIIFFIVVGFTLPLRSICWTLWYNNLASDSEDYEERRPKKKASKKVTAKTFKIEKRGIDPEIIRRARLEDDEY